jgi:hypothetical protein
LLHTFGFFNNSRLLKEEAELMLKYFVFVLKVWGYEVKSEGRGPSSSTTIHA